MEALTNNAAHQAKCAPQPAIWLQDFTFTYPRASAAVLRGVNLSVAAGEYVLLTGATGSGKTTLLRCLKPELAPTGARAGEARVSGAVGYVAQNPETQMVCDSVWHELAFGLENAGVPQAEMRQRVAETAYFFGMEPWFHASVHTLSGGQRQLVNLASVLALRPDIVLLDEPTAQLDPLARRDFAHALWRVNRELGITVVVATHEPGLLSRYATRSVALADGRVVEGEHAVSGEGEDGEGVAPPPTGGGATPRAASNTACGDPDLDFASAPVRAAVADPDPTFSLRDVYAAYAKDAAPVLRGVDLHIRRGTIHGIIGGNGCGKSTLLKVLAGVLAPYRGKLRRAKCVQTAQAYLPQDPRALFLADTLAEELGLWQHTAHHPYGAPEIDAALARFGLAARRNVHPYDLSGGEQQLAALAKLSFATPAVYLLDEPLRGLDVTARQAAIALLRAEAARGATVVVATHDMAFVRDACDEVSFLFDGQIATTQPPEQFFATNLLFAPFLEERA